MRDVFKTLGANVEFESRDTFGHMMPLDMGRYVNKFLYENMPNSGFDKWNPWNEEGDMEWKKDGVFGKFDQSQYTNGYSLENAGLREWGFFYYPNACAKGGCNFQMVYHGCMENSEKTLDLYAPWAASNDLILVAPQAVDCWGVVGGNASPVTDKSYFTNDYIQYHFSKNIIKAISSPIDNKYDYNQNQNLEALSTYPKELFYYMG